MLPSIPIRLIILSVILFLSGIILLVMGFVNEVKSVDPLNGVLCWILSVLVLIPGVYYLVRIIQFYREENPNIREEIIGDIL